MNRQKGTVKSDVWKTGLLGPLSEIISAETAIVPSLLSCCCSQSTAYQASSRPAYQLLVCHFDRLSDGTSKKKGLI